MNTDTDGKPLPTDVPEERPYWEAAARHRLALQSCPECGRFVHPPRPGCPFCNSPRTAWVDLGDEVTGRIYSLVTVHRAFDPSFAADTPYFVALCDIDEAPGIRIVANVVGASEGVEIGSPVEMTWEDRGKAFAVPQWRLQGQAA